MSTTTDAKTTLPYLEHGISKGQEYIVSHIASSEPFRHRALDPPNAHMAELKEYLDSHGYIITLTDKNLGPAIVERKSIIDGGNKLLSNQNSYEPVEYTEVMRESSSLADSILELLAEPLDDSNTTVHDAHPQLAKFLASKLPKQRHCEHIRP